MQSAPAVSETGLPLSEVAYQTLRGKILRCEFEPGEKLKIDTLRRGHGLSSSPLREALEQSMRRGDHAWEARIVSALHRLVKIEGQAQSNEPGAPLTLNADWSVRYRKEPRHKAAEHRRIMEAVIGRHKADALSLLREHTTRTADNVEAAMDKADKVQSLTEYKKSAGRTHA